MMAGVPRQFLLFLLTGGIAAAVNFFSRMLYQRVVNFSVAVVLAYVTGMVTAFLLARTFVFQRGSSSNKKSFAWFTLVNVLAVLQTWGISVWLAYHVLPSFDVETLRYEISHAVGLIIPVFTSFIGHKYLSFR